MKSALGATIVALVISAGMGNGPQSAVAQGAGCSAWTKPSRHGVMLLIAQCSKPVRSVKALSNVPVLAVQRVPKVVGGSGLQGERSSRIRCHRSGVMHLVVCKGYARAHARIVDRFYVKGRRCAARIGFTIESGSRCFSSGCHAPTTQIVIPAKRPRGCS